MAYNSNEIFIRMTERIAIISDTHGHLNERIRGLISSCDHVIHAGDVGSQAVLDALPHSGTTVVVRGNNDLPEKWLTNEHRVLKQLPLEGRLIVPGGEIVVVHGDKFGAPRGRHMALRKRYPCARMVVYGHSHHLCIDKESIPWVCNPGAAGNRRTYGGGPSCLVLTASGYRWLIKSYRFTRS